MPRFGVRTMPFVFKLSDSALHPVSAFRSMFIQLFATRGKLPLPEADKFINVQDLNLDQIDTRFNRWKPVYVFSEHFEIS